MTKLIDLKDLARFKEHLDDRQATTDQTISTIEQIVSPTIDPVTFEYDPNEDTTIVTPLEKTYAYGVLIDWTKSTVSTHLTRLGNMDLHRSLPIQSQFKRCVWNLDTSSILAYLNPDDSTYTEDGTSIATLIHANPHISIRVHTPKFYVSVRVLEKDSVGAALKTVVMMSTIRLGTSYIEVPEMVTDFRNCGIVDTACPASLPFEAEDFYGGYCKTTDDLTTAESGVYCPITNVTRNFMRSNALDYNTYLFNYTSYKWLFFWCPVVEYATLNLTQPFKEALDANGFHQGGLGPGITSAESYGNYNSYATEETRYNIEEYAVSSSITSNLVDGADYYRPTLSKPVAFRAIGVTLNLGNHTGENLVEYTDSQSKTKMIHQNSYRGFEVPFGDLYLNLDGFVGALDNNAEYYWVNDNPDEAADVVPTPYENYGSWRVAWQNPYSEENGYPSWISSGGYDESGYYQPIFTNGNLFPARYWGREESSLNNNQPYVVNTWYPMDGTNGTILLASCDADGLDSGSVGPGSFDSNSGFSGSDPNLGFRCFNIIN